ncbi:MAG: flagellar hook-associated protein 3 [Planctomycetes bacterium]|nr:flagellar hook-associated protein 3 [Planctomycetota bacterium]
MERISLNEVLGQLRSSVFRNYNLMFKSQTQLTTGQRLQRPSDDPAATRRVMDLTAQREAISRHISAGERGQAYLNSSTGALTDITDSLARARELAVQGANGTLSANDRSAIAAELDAILGNVISAANIQLDGRHLFAGTRSTTLPYNLVTGTDGVQRVDYAGDNNSYAVEVAPSVFHDLTLPGSEVFAAGPRSATTFNSLTGALPGAGSDSGHGNDVLMLRHLQTLFGATPTAGGVDPLTGLRPGTSSVAADTVLGTASSIVLTTDATGAGSISLNGGPALTFSGTETNFEVTGLGGEKLFVDVSTLATNLSGASVSVNGRGSLSTDGGLSSVAIDFTNGAQQVVDSETGAVLHVDARGITKSGSVAVRYGTSSNLFDSLIAIRDTLSNGSLTPAEASARLNAAMADLDRGADSLSSAIARLGGRSSQIDRAGERLADLDVTLASLRSAEADVDMAEVMVKMKQHEGLYNASLMMAARVQQLSLLNWL